ncbi:MAG: SMR family transporter [Hyphomicrobiaceae bacterium]|nr:SMR family transporter [Hyphomicrobiaceae bacterium]
MTFSHWLALALCVVGNVSANIGFKRMMATLPLEVSVGTVRYLVTSPWAWLGGLGSLLLLGSYLYAIRSLPIGVAYPMATSLGMVGVALAGTFILGESLRPQAMAGIACIILGIVLIGRA